MNQQMDLFLENAIQESLGLLEEGDSQNKHCSHRPEEYLGQPIGMYHCPLCGQMVIAGLLHPQYPERIER